MKATDTELAPPTIVDVVEAAVRASNNLILYCLAVRETNRDVVTHGAWARLVESDYLLNSAHDSITNSRWDDPEEEG